MVKKTYIQPNCTVVTINTESVIAFSNTSGAEGLGFGGDTSDGGVTEGAVKSSGNSAWGDEW
ncbi:MAG: hypothetical protein IJQ44_08080 [Bacteroidaceae bacterium]|nr:hypothetical protein [Bacteroidaceae bacterium]